MKILLTDICCNGVKADDQHINYYTEEQPATKIRDAFYMASARNKEYVHTSVNIFQIPSLDNITYGPKELFILCTLL